jgi:hypothetical protein
MQIVLMLVKKDFEPSELITLKDFEIILENHLDNVPFEGMPSDLDDACASIEETFGIEFTVPEEWFDYLSEEVETQYAERKFEYLQDKYFERRSAEPDEDWRRE